MQEVIDSPDAATLLVSLSRNVPGAIYRCTLDSSWTMHVIGDEIERISGYPASDFVANRRRSYGSVIHPDDRARVAREVDEAVGAGRAFELEYRLVTAAGEERWVLERGCAVEGEERAWLDGIIFDITERRRVEDAARRAEAETAVARELAESRKRVVLAADEARRRLERDLHDGAQQSFVSALISLGAALRKLDGDAGAPIELLRSTQEHLERGLKDLRDLARGIHPVLLAEHGVAAALSALASRAPVSVTIVDDSGGRLPAEVESALYFSAAEGVTNAAKHADAREVSVRLGRTAQGVHVEIVDDGCGGATLERGSGLRGLRDRLESVGGSVHVVSRPGDGTRLFASVPLT
jgi:PAS domain S-box-containing protein